MKQTAKYLGACQILIYPHSNQDELYSELNRLGWYWQSKDKKWVRDDTPAKEASKFVRVRIIAATNKVEQAAQLFSESAADMGLKFVEKSEPYLCRPPNRGKYSQADTRSKVEEKTFVLQGFQRLNLCVSRQAPKNRHQ